MGQASFTFLLGSPVLPRLTPFHSHLQEARLVDVKHVDTMVSLALVEPILERFPVQHRHPQLWGQRYVLLITDISSLCVLTPRWRCY